MKSLGMSDALEATKDEDDDYLSASRIPEKPRYAKTCHCCFHRLILLAGGFFYYEKRQTQT